MDSARRLYYSYTTRPFKWTTLRFARVYRRLLLRLAVDAISEAGRGSALVLAPHPDDEALGCGALIYNKRTPGTKVQVIFATDGRRSHSSRILSEQQLMEIRCRDAEEACRILELDPDAIEFLGFEDQTLARHEELLHKRLRELISAARPDELYIPSYIDTNIDHRVLNYVAKRAATNVGLPMTVFEYPVWFWDAKSWVDETAVAPIMAWQLLTRPILALSRLNPKLVRAEEHLEVKRQAISAHKSQVANLTGEEGWNQIDPVILDFFFCCDELFFLVD